jgi:gamma-glutamyl phosphate reductase
MIHMTGHALQLATDDELRESIATATDFDEEYRAMVEAIAARDAIHEAIKHIDGPRWGFIRPQHVQESDDDRTVA